LQILQVCRLQCRVALFAVFSEFWGLVLALCVIRYWIKFAQYLLGDPLSGQKNISVTQPARRAINLCHFHLGVGKNFSFQQQRE
jgi:hypothetical protein